MKFLGVLLLGFAAGYLTFFAFRAVGAPETVSLVADGTAAFFVTFFGLGFIFDD